jgi:(p)ppGpp synthase/HD superfamily hydrolase
MAQQALSFSFIAELPVASDALTYAQRMHRGQRRESDEAPSVLHPLEVASMLRNSGHGEPVIAAAILHETIEDTATVKADLAARFGGEIAALVGALSEDQSIASFAERKEALRAQIADFGGAAVAIDAADKVSKVRELRARAANDPRFVLADDDAGERLHHYEASLAMLEQADGAHPLVRQLRFELEALQSLPPKRAATAIEQISGEIG